MDLNLMGKIALVTGATSGVGSEIALSLAAEGTSVAVNDRSSGEEADALVKDIVAKGGKAKAYKADVADFAAVQAMVESIVRDFGGLNILINNAGLAIRQRSRRPRSKKWSTHSRPCSTAPWSACRTSISAR
jgi:3-oxoacyl-[acyl-carrier protein] reductase